MLMRRTEYYSSLLIAETSLSYALTLTVRSTLLEDYFGKHLVFFSFPLPCWKNCFFAWLSATHSFSIGILAPYRFLEFPFATLPFCLGHCPSKWHMLNSTLRPAFSPLTIRSKTGCLPYIRRSGITIPSNMFRPILFQTKIELFKRCSVHYLKMTFREGRSFILIASSTYRTTLTSVRY